MVIMNLLGFFLMMTDKRRARRHKRRISERTLLTVAALGGSLGSLLAMYLFAIRQDIRSFISPCRFSSCSIWR